MNGHDEAITNAVEIAAAFCDEAPPPKVRPLRLDSEVPAFLRKRTETFEMSIDGALPLRVLCQALAAYGLSIINHRNRLVITARPSEFQS